MVASISRILRPVALGCCLLALAACDNLDTTQQRTLSGGAIGAGVGAAGTLMTGGCVACGAAIGAGVGAAGGYIYDQVEKGGHNSGSSYTGSGTTQNPASQTQDPPPQYQQPQ